MKISCIPKKHYTPSPPKVGFTTIQKTIAGGWSIIPLVFLPFFTHSESTNHPHLRCCYGYVCQFNQLCIGGVPAKERLHLRPPIKLLYRVQRGGKLYFAGLFLVVDRTIACIVEGSVIL